MRPIRFCQKTTGEPKSNKTKIETIVVSPAGAGLGGLEVSFQLDPGGTVAASACGPGCYETTAKTTPRRVVVELAGGGYPRSAVSFTLPRAPRPAGELVLRASRVFRDSRSVVYSETLASQPGTFLRSIWKLAAPNSLSYRIRGDTDGIVIGGRRWDRVAGGRWVASPQDPRLPQPATTWSSTVRNAYLVAAGPRELVVSFFDPGIYAWFRLVIDRKTFRPRDMRMIAAAHFMRQHYLAYDKPVGIRPPR